MSMQNRNLVASIGMGFIFLLLLYDVGPIYFMGIASNSWLPTSGKIIISRADLLVNSEIYDAKVRYVYSVDGRPFDCDRLGFPNPKFRTASGTAAYLTEYPVGKPVQVYYNANNPAEACLHRGPNNKLLSSKLLMVGLVGLISVLGLLRFGRKNN